MDATLSGAELRALFARVFGAEAERQPVVVIADLPDRALADNGAWRARRELAAQWVAALSAEGGPGAVLYWYRNVRVNNADLPELAWPQVGQGIPDDADALADVEAQRFEALFGRYRLFVAPTELSTTAPLKLAARRHGIQAATMPGFSPAMVPALRLDYLEVDRRVRMLAALLDRASAAELSLTVDGEHEQRLTIDLRHRGAHASGGLMREPGTAGNLPSGEAYIVPYEGERAGDASRTAGTIPVQLDDAVVLYQIERNQVIDVGGDRAAADSQRARIAEEPARGNVAELGLGVLADFGVQAVGETLLDEKLGLHVAFGRSDHFGGQIGSADFSAPERVEHIDRVYLPSVQPRIHLERLDLQIDGQPHPLMADGRYTIDFSSAPHRG